MLNIYEDSYSYTYNNTINDLLTYSYIDKGASYRKKIINEVSPRTISLMKSVNIRVIQDYLKEEKIDLKEFNKLSCILKDTIKLPIDELMIYTKNQNTML